MCIIFLFDALCLTYLFSTGEINLRLGKIGIFAVAALRFMDKAIDLTLVDFEFGLKSKVISKWPCCTPYRHQPHPGTYLLIVAFLDCFLHGGQGAFCIVCWSGHTILDDIKLLDHLFTKLIEFLSQPVGSTEQGGIGFHGSMRGVCFRRADDGRIESIKFISHATLEGRN